MEGQEGVGEEVRCQMRKQDRKQEGKINQEIGA